MCGAQQTAGGGPKTGGVPGPPHGAYHQMLATHLLTSVYLGDVVLGHGVDVLFDHATSRVLGVEVRCGDGDHRFAPLGVIRPGAGRLVVESPLALLDRAQLEFYAARGVSFRRLRGTTVRHLGRVAGELDDVEVDRDGAVEWLLLRHKGEIARVPATAAEVGEQSPFATA